MAYKKKNKVDGRKPPVEYRFKPGQSGNPNGRPKGSLNLKTHLIETLSERITITEGPKSRRVNKLRALVLSLAAKGIKGDARAAAYVLSLVQQSLTDEPAQDQTAKLSPEDEAILRDFLERASESQQPPASRDESSDTKTSGTSNPSEENNDQ